MTEAMTLPELVEAVNQWCEEHRVEPANGQAADRLSERNVRFYRTTGLLEAPASADGRGYGEIHRLQLIAVRLLQAQGLPLRRIRELLHGRTLEDLREIEKRGIAEMAAARCHVPDRLAATGAGTWSVAALDEDFLLVSRRDRPIPPDLLKRLRAALRQPD
jgi:DNA-binding transcriptional MerR regulator